MTTRFLKLTMAFGVLLAFSASTLGHGYMVKLDQSAQEAAATLSYFEQQYQANDQPEARFYLMSKLAPTAFKAGDMDKAKAYALELLRQASTFPTNWNYGNAIHVGNLVLGRIALTSNDLVGAKQYLIESGKTPGSPQLNSFGPNMILAKELLERGEREAVLEYFALCTKFWEMPGKRLENWTATVKGGAIPNFRANLVYGLEFER